ncbi:MAG: hypothetical protein OFPII_04460 [Osedax symbiont Rs1]|nr:MAG: hypothetical protein OFPII_04460 [Osedax symbiont Rs1]
MKLSTMFEVMKAQALVVLAIVLLQGCTAASKSASIISDPDIQVGDEGEGGPSTVLLSLFAARDVNENYLGEGTPIDFHVIFMKDDSKMLAADFDELTFAMEDSLGKNYLIHDDYSLIPNQYKYVEALEVPEGTRYLGVVARFADPNQTQWKKSMRIKNKGHVYKFLMQFNREHVDFIKEDY